MFPFTDTDKTAWPAKWRKCTKRTDTAKASSQMPDGTLVKSERASARAHTVASVFSSKAVPSKHMPLESAPSKSLVNRVSLGMQTDDAPPMRRRPTQWGLPRQLRSDCGAKELDQYLLRTPSTTFARYPLETSGPPAQRIFENKNSCFSSMSSFLQDVGRGRGRGERGGGFVEDSTLLREVSRSFQVKCDTFSKCAAPKTGLRSMYW